MKKLYSSICAFALLGSSATAEPSKDLCREELSNMSVRLFGEVQISYRRSPTLDVLSIMNISNYEEHTHGYSEEFVAGRQLYALVTHTLSLKKTLEEIQSLNKELKEIQ